MKAAHLCLLSVLALTLASCASFGRAPAAYQPPRIDCEALAVPRVKQPAPPALTDKSLTLWQLYAWGWQAYAEDVLSQRVETAICLNTLKEQGAIR